MANTSLDALTDVYVGLVGSNSVLVRSFKVVDRQSRRVPVHIGRSCTRHDVDGVEAEADYTLQMT